MLEESTWPLLLFSPVLGYFAVRLVWYAALALLGRELPFDAEMHERGHSLLLGRSLRQVFAWSLAPIVELLVRARVGPNTLTLLCFVLSAFAGACIAFGALTLGGVVGLFGASLDYFDGRVARRSQRVTRAGGFLDSTLDRFGEVALFTGAAVLLRDSAWLLTVCLLSLGASGIVSYTRAKAESLGVELRSGTMQRPERVVLFCAGACADGVLSAFSPAVWRSRHAVFAGVLVALAVLTAHTAIQRTIQGYSALRRAEAAGSSGR